MDKEMLFRFMRAKFRDAGFTPDEIELHIKNFSDRYEGRTDEEIEADMMRRGGPSKVVARVIEQRNSILMKDAEYRAFVEGESSEDITDASASVPKEAPNAEAPLSETPKSEAQAEEDPLRGWFSDTGDDTAAADALSEMLRDPKNAGAAAQYTPKAHTSSTAASQTDSEDDDVKIASPGKIQAKQSEVSMSEVHTIPLFEDPPAPRPQNTPPRRPTPRPDQDNGTTKVIHVARGEDAAPVRNQPGHPVTAGQMKQTDPFFAPQPVTDDHRTEAHPGTWKTPVYAPAQKEQTQSKQKKKERPAFLRLPEITYWGEGSLEGVRRFRIIFGVSLPFVILFCAALLVLLLGLTVAIAAAVIALVVALVVWVALGSIIALVGIIYGISQLFLVVPVGMFELGLGIAAVGITMLGGILIYNLAVRFFPFALRGMYRFAGFFRHYLVDLYYYVKGECYRR